MAHATAVAELEDVPTAGFSGLMGEWTHVIIVNLRSGARDNLHDDEDSTCHHNNTSLFFATEEQQYCHGGGPLD